MKTKQRLELRNFDAVIYDMDGLLIDSEPLWQQAEIMVFRKIGIELTIENCLETTGLPTKDVIAYWYKKQPWQGPSLQEVEDELYKEVIKMIGIAGKAMPGVVESLSFFRSKGLKIGLASASPMALIEASLKKCNLTEAFDFYHSGTLENKNKPNPALYHTVAKRLNVSIDRCMILEDSGNGILGASQSGAYAVAIPASHEYYDSKFDLANQKFSSLYSLLSSL